MNDGLKKKYRKAIIKIIAACPRVSRAVLFGSRSMGTFTTTSDVDIDLFGDELTLGDQAGLAAEIEELTMPQSVDLILYRTIKNKKLIKHINDHGVQWWPEDEKERAKDEVKRVNCGLMGG
jgi:predicted nucleotidyltransferase